jgi:hypothetical protein
MEGESGGIFNIELDDAAESVDESERIPRNFQSENDFKKQRDGWKPKSEVGEVSCSSPY